MIRSSSVNVANFGRRCAVRFGLALVISSLALSQTGLAQSTPQLVPATPNLAQNKPVILRAEAFAGKPYGVGKMTFRLQPGDELVDRTDALLITDAENRILYPVVSAAPFQAFIQNFSGNREMPVTGVHTVWFLFEGEQPLDVMVVGSDTATRYIEVEFARERQFDRRVRQWWDAFNQNVNYQIESGDYPSLVQVYLKSLIGKRFGLSIPPSNQRNPDPLFQTFELMFDLESLQTSTIESEMALGVQALPVDQPMPAPIRWTPVIVENLPQTIAIEPIAKFVPRECFYLRFGTWSNQIWLQQLMEEFGGDLSRMIQVRGFKYRIQSKFLDQLAIQSTDWDRLFGGRLIDDVAVIGTDTYVDSGSAIGVMLHAISSDALGNNLRNKRKQFAADNKELGAEIINIPFGDDSIEFLSTPDNRYRSFYAVSGNCHLMTTSLVIAKRFLEAGRGIGSMADSAEYKFARYNMPLDRDDTVFIYLSTEFFQNLLTPQYQIELRRRNRISTDMMLLELAKLAADNEGYGDQTIDGLVRAGYLPTGFGYRPDGGTFATKGNHWQDSIRGRRGFFAPIPDLPLSSVTAEEVAWFEQRARFFSDSIKSLDPMFVAVKRYQLKGNIERVVFDARLALFGEEKYGWLMSMLGPPLMQEVGGLPGDVATFQASMKGSSFKEGAPPYHQIFAGIQDQIDPNIDLRPTTFFRLIRLLKEVPGYVGSWPGAGYTDWLPALGGSPDAEGYTHSRFLDLWRLQWDEFSVLSFDKQYLESLKPNLRIMDAQRPAQIRLTIGDLSASRLSNWANSINYQRQWQTSIANTQLLNLLTQQFRIAPEAAKAVIERMLDVELICSLGGEYQLSELPSGRLIWESSAWPSFASPELPDGHTAPFLIWFRGFLVEVIKTESQFSMHGFLDIERTDEQKSNLPSFDMFKGFGNLFGASNETPKAPEPKQ